MRENKNENRFFFKLFFFKQINKKQLYPAKCYGDITKKTVTRDAKTKNVCVYNYDN